MSQNLYIESIAEARQLREIAEANARNKIIDAITPQIRNLIERSLLSDDDNPEEEPEDTEGTEDSDDVELEDDADEEPEMSDDLLADEGEDGELISSMPNPRTTGITSSPATTGGQGAQINVKDDGKISLTLDDVEIVVGQKQNAFEGVEDRATSGKSRKSTAQRAKIFEMKYNLFKIMLQKEHKRGIRPTDRKKFVQILETLHKQAVKLKSDAIITEGNSKVSRKLDNLIKEISMSRKSMNQNVFDFLFEMNEVDPMEGMKVEEEDKLDEADEADDDAGGEPDVDAAVEALEKALAALKGEGEDEDADMGDMDMGDLGGDDEGDEPEEEEEEPEEKNEADVYEIDESVLRRELRRMKRLSEVTSGVDDPKFTARAFGGGKVEDEMFIDVDEETLLNVLADELGRVKFKGGKMHESASYRRAVSAPRRNNETAALRAQVGEYRAMTESMKAQLVEMNLFNAKLLYANKLMQNKNLTAKQQRAIVEALDNAKTLREAKLLYKSLTESLNKGGANRSLTEGATRTLGSSSRSTQSAQVRPTSNGVEVDRWAVLAGIASKK